LTDSPTGHSRAAYTMGATFASRGRQQVVLSRKKPFQRVWSTACTPFSPDMLLTVHAGAKACGRLGNPV